MHINLTIESLTPAPLSLIILIVGLPLGIYIRNQQSKPKSNSGYEVETAPKPIENDNGSGTRYPPIQPLPDFDWEITAPLAFRPFKPKYHLTMAISNLDPSSLIPMDKTYKDRLALRQTLLSQYPNVVRGINTTASTRSDLTSSAIRELYTFLIGTYLPTRYPRMFELSGTGSNTMLTNKVTTRRAPVYPAILNNCSNDDDLTLLDTLGTWVDEDFLILLPESGHPGPLPASSPHVHDEHYILQAYTTYYPAGFDTRTKLGRRLADIHAPVPGYHSKLEKSMDRFFAKLEVGKFVQRVNWSISTGETGLFAAFGGLHGGGHQNEEKGIETGGLDIESTVVRCERQTLHRMPESKALVFAFHTYTYPIQEIKDEGLGEELATAIDGLKEGSVPGIHQYKRSSVWGEAVKAFLRV